MQKESVGWQQTKQHTGGVQGGRENLSWEGGVFVVGEHWPKVLPTNQIPLLRPPQVRAALERNTCW